MSHEGKREVVPIEVGVESIVQLPLPGAVRITIECSNRSQDLLKTPSFGVIPPSGSSVVLRLVHSAMETLSFVSKTRTPHGAGASLVNVTTCVHHVM